MANSRKDMAEMATARANVYGLLADVFREEPSQAFLKKLRTPEFSGALNALDLSLDDMFETQTEAELAETLALEYARLFIGPGSHISPHESMHVVARFGEPNSLWGPATVAVKKFIEGAGLKIADSFSGMPDHISAEFEFMQELARKEAEAWTEGNAEIGSNILKIEERFFTDHLSQWIAGFCDKIRKATNNQFYTHFAEVTQGFLDFEGETLRELSQEFAQEEKLSA